MITKFYCDQVIIVFYTKF